MRGAATVLVSIVLSAGMLAAQGRASKALHVYVIDTEGGKATLYVAPGGQTVLVDSGNPGGRDTDRIMAALSDAGAAKISAQPDGTFIVANSRNGFSKTYATRAK